MPKIARLIYRNFAINVDASTLTVLIAMPALYVIFFGLGYQSMMSGGSSYLSFLAPGIMASQALMAGLFTGGMLWSDRRWGMLAQILVSPFSRLDYLVGLIVTSISIGLIGSAAMLAIALALLQSFNFTLIGVSLMVITLTLGSVFFGSLFLIIAALVKSSVTFNSLQNILVFALDFASTVFYPLSGSIPLPMRILMAANPLTYVADLTRDGFFNEFTASTAYQLIGLAAASLLLLYGAAAVYSKMKIYTQ